MKKAAREWVVKAEDDYVVAQRELRARKSPSFNASHGRRSLTPFASPPSFAGVTVVSYLTPSGTGTGTATVVP